MIVTNPLRTPDCDCSQLWGRLQDRCLGKGQNGRPDPSPEETRKWRQKYCGETPRGRAPAVPFVHVTGGPGTELQKILKELGFNLKESCGCGQRSKTMDEWGVEGCRKHRAQIVSWLKEAAAETTLQEQFRAAWTGLVGGIWLNPLDVFNGLVDRAIRQAEEQCNDDTHHTIPQGSPAPREAETNNGSNLPRPGESP